MSRSLSAVDATRRPLLRIATRGSQLALWQAKHVRDLLLREQRGLQVELLVLKTRGDQIVDRQISEVGGKGLFVKELEMALLEGQADLAVHSLKDVPAVLPENLELSIILPREHPADALILREGKSLEDLPSGAFVGTSSLRRAAQLLHLRPDLMIRSLRGNVPTRLKKLDAGEVDAAVLAVAGLRRLELEERISLVLTPEQMLPAIGQGVLGLETRCGDWQTLNWLRHLEDDATRDCVIAERRLLEELEGNCHIPLAGHCCLENETLYLRALIAEPDGSRLIRSEDRSARSRAVELGTCVARRLLEQGGGELLKKLPHKEEK